MARETSRDSPSGVVAALLVILPILAGGLLFLLFETGPIHRLGLYLVGAGVVVGAALLLLRWE